MPDIDWQIDLAAAAIAIVALVISVWFGWRQINFELESLRQKRDDDVIAWSDAAIDACCKAEMVLRPEFAAVSTEQEFEQMRFETLAVLSSCIDRGRLYFPNIEDDEYGLHKECAYRGHRHAALDQLVGVYDILKRVTHKMPDAKARLDAREGAILFKREFVSIVQSQVDPRRRVKFLGRAI